jgi:hypothetical protein
MLSAIKTKIFTLFLSFCRALRVDVVFKHKLSKTKVTRVGISNYGISSKTISNIKTLKISLVCIL